MLGEQSNLPLQEKEQIFARKNAKEETTEDVLPSSRRSRPSSLDGTTQSSKELTQKHCSPEKKLSQEEMKRSDKNKGVLNSMLKYGRNFYYVIRGRNYSWNQKSNTYMLGECYHPDQKDRFQKDLRSVLWFSYREGFPILPSSDPGEYGYSSDMGWGCMIRAGQMMLAEVLKRNTFTLQGEYLKAMLDHSLVKICEYFADVDQNPLDTPFSIHNICRDALVALNKQPGKWYTSSGIIFMLNNLLEKFSENMIQLRLKIILFNEGVIFEDELLKKASMPLTEFCKRKSTKPALSNEESKREEIQTSDSRKASLEDFEWNHGVFIVVTCKTGLEKPDKDSLSAISALLKFKQSVGILSGKGKRAYYIIGLSDKDLLYLDPHYVQKAAKEKDEICDIMPTYTVQECLSMRIEKMSTCVGFGFYFDGKQDYLDFRRDIQLLKEKNPNFIIGFEEKAPVFRPDVVESVIINESEVQDFDIMDDSCLS